MEAAKYVVCHAGDNRSYFNYYDNRATALIEFFNADFWNCRSVLCVVKHSNSVPEYVFQISDGSFSGYAINIYNKDFTLLAEVPNKLGLLYYVLNPSYFGCRMHIMPTFFDKDLAPEFFGQLDSLGNFR